MIRLLQLELQKLLLNRASKILIFISFVLPFFVIILSSLKINFFGLFVLDLSQYGIFEFPLVWHITTFFASLFKFFFAVVVVSMVGNEYSNGTIKQNLIDGLSKREFILSKFYTIVFFAAIATFLITLISLFIGMVQSDMDEVVSIFAESEFLIAYFVKLVAFFSLCLLLGILVKRSAFALGFLFVLYVIESIAYGIVAWQSDAAFADKVQQWFPLKSMYNLINQPIERIVMSKLGGTGRGATYDYLLHWYEVAIVLGWTAICIFLSYKILQKRDL
jgi:ABC-2 type transport system permease protein